jgi:hypothetical protein
MIRNKIIKGTIFRGANNKEVFECTAQSGGGITGKLERARAENLQNNPDSYLVPSLLISGSVGIGCVNLHNDVAAIHRLLLEVPRLDAGIKRLVRIAPARCDGTALDPTVIAIKAYQMLAGLEPDGKIFTHRAKGAKTFVKLVQDSGHPFSGGSTPPGKYLLAVRKDAKRIDCIPIHGPAGDKDPPFRGRPGIQIHKRKGDFGSQGCIVLEGWNLDKLYGYVNGCPKGEAVLVVIGEEPPRNSGRPRAPGSGPGRGLIPPA